MVLTTNGGTGRQWLQQGCIGGLSVWLASMQEQLPRGLRVTRVANGAAELRSGDEYEVKLILVPAPEQTSNAAQSGSQHPLTLLSDSYSVLQRARMAD